MIYIPHKRFLIHAVSEEIGVFICFEYENVYFTVEHLNYEFSSDSVAIHSSVANMLKFITWHDWIKEGLTDYGKMLFSKYDEWRTIDG